MGPIDEAGKAANTFLDALKGQPLSLALVVMNVALLLLVFWTANQQSESRKEMATLILQRQAETELLLSKCIDADTIKKMLGL